jgi:hypothetical protein
MDPDPQFARLESQIEDLHDKLDRCRQSILMSRAAIWGGALVLALVFTLLGRYQSAPVILGAMTAIIAGIVWAGASKSSRDDLRIELAEAETKKSRLIDEIALRNGWRDLTPTVH